jgi:excisionase family DNA binding protein
MLEPAYSVSYAARMLRGSRKTVYRLIWRGELKAMRVGRLLRIRMSEMNR